MKRQTIYLAGPISGLGYNEVTDWRDAVKARLDGPLYHCLSPMRGKEALREIKDFQAAAENKHAIWVHELYERDRYDVMRSDILFVNLLDAKKVSIGTMFEIAWGYQTGKFILTIMEDGNCHHHGFVHMASSIIVPTVDRACQYLLRVLNQ